MTPRFAPQFPPACPLKPSRSPVPHQNLGHQNRYGHGLSKNGLSEQGLSKNGLSKQDPFKQDDRSEYPTRLSSFRLTQLRLSRHRGKALSANVTSSLQKVCAAIGLTRPNQASIGAVTYDPAHTDWILPARLSIVGANLDASQTSRTGRHTSRRSAARRGSLLVEAALSAAIVATVIIAVAQLLALVVQQQRQLQQRQLALETVANLLDQAYALPWDQLSESGLATLRLPSEVETRLPGAALRAQVLDIPNEGTTERSVIQSARRIEIGLQWFPASRTTAESVQLQAWRFPLSAPSTPNTAENTGRSSQGTDDLTASALATNGQPITTGPHPEASR